MKICPMLGESCKHGSCAWFCKEDGRCAIAVLPSVLDWLTRFAVTKPYERVEDHCQRTSDTTG